MSKILEAKSLVDAAKLEASILRKRVLKAALRESRQEIYKIALQVAETVIGEAIRMQPSSITKRITPVLNTYFDTYEEPVVSVSPSDFDVVKQSLNEIEIKADPEIRSGNAVITHDQVKVVLSLESHLERIRDVLINERD